MIPLRLKAQIPPLAEPIAIRLRDRVEADFQPDHDAYLVGHDAAGRDYDFQGFSLRIEVPQNEFLDGDVVLALPGRDIVHRLIRATSPHNTFLVTEQCDQLCVMCSQPPKRHHTDLFPVFEQAALLAPQNAVIGFSGGEPTLYKHQLLDLLIRVSRLRTDLQFHILTNGQHFTLTDRQSLESLPRDRVVWGVPLYAADAETHDTIVVKGGAHEQLQNTLSLLRSVGALVELRTVVMQPNLHGLPKLATTIARNWSFCATWALMQLEPIGYGRQNWRSLFVDTGEFFQPVAEAINIAAARGIDVALYNFPLCTMPRSYRRHAPATISDWKQKYEPVCDRCELRNDCGGFFEWYDRSQGFTRLGLG